MGFAAIREDRLQPGIKVLCEGQEVLFIVKLGVLEPCWRRENKMRKRTQETASEGLTFCPRSCPGGHNFATLPDA